MEGSWWKVEQLSQKLWVPEFNRKYQNEPMVFIILTNLQKKHISSSKFIEQD